MEKFRPPINASETSLPFEQLEWKTFETFCCNLFNEIAKHKNEEITIYPIGKFGQTQGGADIFIQHKDKIVLYEVKKYQKFNENDYRNTVERFFKNFHNWNKNSNKPLKEFNLIVSTNISAKTIQEWTKNKTEALNIEINIIDKFKLNKIIKNYPSVVYKHFDEAWTKSLFGEKTLNYFKKYGVFEFKEASSWENYTKPEEIIVGNNLKYINEHVKLDAYLPTTSEVSASCLLEFRNGRFSHVQITLSHKQLLEVFFVGCGTKLSKLERPFIAFKDENVDYCCDIGNSRIKLKKEEVEALYKVFDIFWKKYRKRIIEIENLFKTNKFRYRLNTTNNIPLVKITRGLWSVILGFAKANDSLDTVGEWSIFDSNWSYLKIHTKNTTEELDAGYHAFIVPIQDNNNFNLDRIDNTVVLTWKNPIDLLKSNSKKEDCINTHQYWDAETTYNWLVKKLIPKVVEWNKNRNKNLIEKIFKKKEIYSESNYIYSKYFEDNSNIANVNKAQELLKTIKKLQSFYYVSNKVFFIDSKDFSRLLNSLYLILNNSDWDLNYIKGDLGFLLPHNKECNNNSLIKAIQKYAEENKNGCNNSYTIDLILRSMLVPLRDFKSNLSTEQINQIEENLKILLEIREDNLLLKHQLDNIN